ncbi:MAG: nickel-binding protein [Gaiella sp.]
MPSYLAESYVPRREHALEEAASLARRAAELGQGVRYIRTTFVPGDETVLHVFEATSAESLQHASRLAALPVDRIVEIIEHWPDTDIRERGETA